jgi:FdrA protein
MSVLVSAIRPGAYRDSIVLMQLQVALAELPGVEDAGVVMATPENLGLLETSGLLPDPAPAAGPTDLCVVVRAETKEAGEQALDRIGDLLRRGSSGAEGGFRPHSLEAAAKLAPGARFALVSVPGRYAAGVARQALDLGLHVFLYSDNVGMDEEIRLKRSARDAGLLVMGPDCGTALIGGAGLGFANRVRRGHIGIVAASGTGLQAVASAIHELGRGVSQGIGTGGRDLSRQVGAITALQAVDILRRDPETRVVVLISKPPAPEVADRLLAAAGSTGKPVVVAFQGVDDAPGMGAASNAAGADHAVGLHFAEDLSEAARLAVALDGGQAIVGSQAIDGGQAVDGRSAPSGTRSGNGAPAAGALAPYFRGLFSGGTLALETLLKLRGRLDPLYSNLGSEGSVELDDPGRSLGHTVLDLGADEFTVGRPHPMIDNDLRVRRLRREINDPEVGLIMLDVVLGYGAHPDPAAELAPVIAEARRPDLAVAAIVVGTDEDPQEIQAQIELLENAGAHVHRDVAGAVSHALDLLGVRRDPAATAPVPGSSAPRERPAAVPASAASEYSGRPVALDDLASPAAAINVGLERFAESLAAQEVEVIQVDWRPPAGGDERLLEILDKLRR